MLDYVSDMHTLHTICDKLARKLVWFLKCNTKNQILIGESKMGLAKQQSDIKSLQHVALALTIIRSKCPTVMPQELQVTLYQEPHYFTNKPLHHPLQMIQWL
jgi:hypothetical protein